MGKQNTRLVANVDFPPYVIDCFGSNHFVCAGGGGPAKTGIPNVIETIEIVQCDRNVLDAATLERSMTDDYPESEHEAIMNGAVTTWKPRDRSAFFAAGMNNKCYVFEVFKEPQKTARLVGSFKSEDDNQYQTAVAWSYDNTLIVTAGSSGKISVWKYPEMKLKHTIQAHKNDIECLTACPVASEVVSCSRDGSLKQIDLDKGLILNDLFWTSDEEKQKAYKCRTCAYGIVNNDRKRIRLYSLQVPKVMKTKKKPPIFIVMWNNKLLPERKALLHKHDNPSCIAISSCGNFLGIGSLEGNVSLYVSFSLRCIKRVVGIHDNFITNLCFAPVSFVDNKGTLMHSRVFSDYEALLLSISIDKTVQMIGVEERQTLSVMTSLLLCVMVLCLVGLGIGIGSVL